MKKTGTSSRALPTKEKILSWYVQDVLEGKEPGNVYLFSKEHGLKENAFYQFFNSLEGIENHYFEILFKKTVETLAKSSQYTEYPAKEKLLSFYYTFFGNLTTNRSFVLQLLNSGKLENIRKLKGMHKYFITYIHGLDIEMIDLKSRDLNTIPNRALEEVAWLQLISILKFWIHDNSADFEKTDILIEKAVTTGFELINMKALKSVLDLGKFIFKEMNPGR